MVATVHVEGSEGSEGSKPPSEPLPSALPSPRDNSTPPQAGKGAEVAVLAEEPETRREHPREHTSRASAPFAPFAPLGGQALPSQTPTCHLHPDRPRPDACYTCEQVPGEPLSPTAEAALAARLTVLEATPPGGAASEAVVSPTEGTITLAPVHGCTHTLTLTGDATVTLAVL